MLHTLGRALPDKTWDAQRAAAHVSVIEVSPKAPLYTEYTGTTDALETVEIRARVDGFIDQKLFNGGQVIKAGERLYLLDQRTFIAEVQKASRRGEGRSGPAVCQRGVEVFRAESRLAQSRAALIKTEQDVARYTPWSRTRLPRNKTWTGL